MYPTDELRVQIQRTDPVPYRIGIQKAFQDKRDLARAALKFMQRISVPLHIDTIQHALSKSATTGVLSKYQLKQAFDSCPWIDAGPEANVYVAGAGRPSERAITAWVSYFFQAAPDAIAMNFAVDLLSSLPPAVPDRATEHMLARSIEIGSALRDLADAHGYRNASEFNESLSAVITEYEEVATHMCRYLALPDNMPQEVLFRSPRFRTAIDGKIDEPVLQYLARSLSTDLDSASSLIRKLSVYSDIWRQWNELDSNRFAIFNADLSMKADHSYQALFSGNLRLVLNIARRANSSLPIEDRFQEGSIGLLKAIDRFDYRRGFKFSTYATWWIRQAVGRAIDDQSSLIRIPIHMRLANRKLIRAEKEFTKQHARIPTDSELSNALNQHCDQLQKIREAAFEFLPLDQATIDSDADRASFDIGKIEDDLEQDEMSTQINVMLATLTERERVVIYGRYGLIDGIEHTLQYLGDALKITRERVRQIEVKAIKKLSTAPYAQEIGRVYHCS